MLTGVKSCAKRNTIYSFGKDTDTKEFTTINYKDTSIQVGIDGTIIWNNTVRAQYLNSDGYPVVSIKTNKGWRSISVARLVAIAYIPNPHNLPEVNHKDYNRQNYRVDNLEWVTHEENVRYSNCNRPDYSNDKNPNYGNKKLSKIYQHDPEYAKEKQSRPGLRNGRCRKITLIQPSGECITFDYIVKCCEFIQEHYCSGNVSIESIRCKIDKLIRNDTTYKGLRFVKE